MIANVQRLVELIRESDVLDAGQFATLTQTIRPRCENAQLLARELVRRGWLTSYQVEVLTKGAGQDLILGPYVILEPIATGGMGQIYKARHRQTGKVAAVKVVRKDRRGDVKVLSRFRREIEALTHLSHPNIVALCDLDEIGVAHYYAMEYVDGVDLEEVIAQTGPLPVAAACDYIRQAACGLAHAHERGLIHRDIKPGNLLVARTAGNGVVPPGVPAAARERFGRWGQVKLLDLGLVLLQDPELSTTPQAQLTQQGYALGTVDYMAPEQIVNPHKVDTRADLYALGCTFYEMLTGHEPFPGGSQVDKLVAHRAKEPIAIHQERPNVPGPVEGVVRKLMAKKPEDRFQTPGELADALTNVLVRLDRAAVDLTWQPPSFKQQPAPAPEVPAPAAKAADDDSVPVLYVVLAVLIFVISFVVLYMFL
jgi:serine/threonine-protein kinase